MPRRWRAGLWLLIMLGMSSPAGAETLSQVLRAPAAEQVIDFAKVLSPAERSRLRIQLQAMAKSGSARGAIIVVSRVDGEPIESFAKRFGNQRLRAGNDSRNRFVLVVAISQRKWRLDTNRALREKIPDSDAKTLMQKALVPPFRQKQYAKGLALALKAIDVASRRASIDDPVKPSRNHMASANHESAFVPKPDGILFLIGALATLVVGLGGLVLVGSLIGGSIRTASEGGWFDSSQSRDLINTPPSNDLFASGPESTGGDNSVYSASSDGGGGGGDGGGASGSW